MEATESLIKFLQSCISPIVLISGVGLILLSLNNRLARTIDKSRMIVNELKNGQVVDKDKKRLELKVLFKRSKILRNSIVSISFSILSSSLIIPVLLLMNLFHVNLKFLGILFFHHNDFNISFFFCSCLEKAGPTKLIT
ncbi:MAG: DUF2721 domain-containing protein [Desulfobacterales bacterium]|nr:DUF2721 domain-containing protein [Desulfobacterales bacterium]